MAKILCALSGISFTCEHFPITLESRETYHPIFDVSQKKLLPYLGKWSSNQLTLTDSYLLFLSLLHSSELVQFRTSVLRTTATDSIVAQNMEFLAKTVIKLNTVSTPAKLFPSFAITSDTRDLSNVHHWIENWKEHYDDFQNGLRRDYDTRKLVKRESALERLIKSPHKPISSYSSQLADWASIAGQFPSYAVKSPFNGFNIALSDYWKLIISRCANESQLYSVPKADLEELIEHCEENIGATGSIFSHALFKVLRTAQRKQASFLGYGDKDIGETTYSILESSDDVEDLNIKLMIDTAPEFEPKPDQYPTKFEFMRAKARWDMAKRYAPPKSSPSNQSSEES